MKETTVSLAPAGLPSETVLPLRVQEALGELVGAAKEGLLALSVGVGLGVLAELMEEEVDEAVGPKGKHDPDRSAVRHGHEAGEVTLGGRRLAVERPRVRSVDGQAELPLATYAHFADRDPLTAVVLERMLAGVSTRRYRRTAEPVGSEVERAARSTSRFARARECPPVQKCTRLVPARRGDFVTSDNRIAICAGLLSKPSDVLQRWRARAAERSLAARTRLWFGISRDP